MFLKLSSPALAPVTAAVPHKPCLSESQDPVRPLLLAGHADAGEPHLENNRRIIVIIPSHHHIPHLLCPGLHDAGDWEATGSLQLCPQLGGEGVLVGVLGQVTLHTGLERSVAWQRGEIIIIFNEDRVHLSSCRAS